MQKVNFLSPPGQRHGERVVTPCQCSMFTLACYSKMPQIIQLPSKAYYSATIRPQTDLAWCRPVPWGELFILYSDFSFVLFFWLQLPCVLGSGNNFGEFTKMNMNPEPYKTQWKCIVLCALYSFKLLIMRIFTQFHCLKVKCQH